MTIPNPATILITGASSGIGRAIAEKLTAPGRTLHLMGRDTKRLQSIADHVQSGGGKPICHVSDLAEPEQFESDINQLKQQITQLDVIIHSAGVVSLGPLASAPVDDLDWMMRINLRAPLLLTQTLMAALREAQGQVVFINSGAGLRAKAGWGQYAATKFALKALADSLREEVASDGIRVLSVFPGRTASPMQARVRKLEGSPYNADDYMQPIDVAEMVAQSLTVDRRAGVHELNIR